MRFILTIVWLLHLFQCIQPLHLADYSTALTSLERITFIALQLTQSTEVNSLNSAQLKELSIGFLSGAASRALKEIVLHPIDTVKTRLQSPLGKKSRRLFESVYDGLIPSLIGGVPATATFFAVKDFCKRMLKDSVGDALTKSEVTILAVIVANFPYWIIRTPFEVQKTVEQTSGLNRSSQIHTIEGIKSSYRSYFSNILYSLPADILKFVCCKLFYFNLMRPYSLQGLDDQINEVLFSQSDVIEGANAAVSGALASAVAQLITTPVSSRTAAVTLQISFQLW